jgi:perosamine synthetase
MDPNRKYFFPVIGYNYRLTNIACAMLCAQLERFDEMIKKRREISDLYREGLGRVAGVNVQPSAEWAEPVTWLMSITVDPDRFGRDRDRTMECLGEQGIETRPFFIPIHRLPPYEMVPRITLPITESLSKTGINLPTFTSMGEDTVWEVVEALKALS